MTGESFGRNEPFDTPIGPTVKERGAANGLITRHGYIVAEWGDPRRVDMTHSVTKTFLTTVVGLAWQRGLIRDVNDYARDYMPAERRISSRRRTTRRSSGTHLLRQTSDWQGTLWGKPDWADRPEGEKPSDWPNRKLREPGTHYKYNDVRVNVAGARGAERLAPSAAGGAARGQSWSRSAPRRRGAGTATRTRGWRSTDSEMQSVSGGGHWGGGMFINAYDMARFGYLFLRNGKWNGIGDRVSEVDQDGAHARSGQRDVRLRELVPEHGPASRCRRRPRRASCFRGNGANIIYDRLGARHRRRGALDRTAAARSTMSSARCSRR